MPSLWDVFAPYQPFVVSGAAGCMATTVIQPVDFLKTRLQLSGEGVKGAAAPSPLSVARQVIKTEGIAKMYSGLSAGLARQVIYGSSRLGLYRVFADKLKDRRGGGVIPVWEKIAAGVAAGGIASCLGNPADLSLIRMQADATLPPAARRNYTGIFNAVSRIVREEGLFALWKGSSPTVIRAVVLNATNMPVSDTAKELLGPSLGGPTSMATKVVSSVLSGVASSVTSLPFDMIKTRLQKQVPGPDGKLPYRSLLHCATVIATTEGPAAFFKGLSTYIVRIAPHITLSLVLLDSMNEWVDEARKAAKAASAGPAGARK